MTTILIPTDFSAESLKIAEQAVKSLDKEVNVMLFHAYEMPFYYQDLFGGEKPPYYNMLTDNFRQACKQLKEQYPRLINRIYFQYTEGNTNSLFRNFAEAHHVELIVCPANYVYKKTHARSINPVPFFRKSKIPMMQEFTPAVKPALETIRIRLEREDALATA